MNPIKPLYDSLHDAARTTLDRVVLIDAESHLTYGELLEAIDCRARSLLSHCNPGALVGVLIDCSADTVITYYACLRAAMVYTPLFACPPTVLANLIKRLGLAVLVTDQPIDSPIPTLSPQDQVAGTTGFPEPDPALPAHLLLTSGTTAGVPKAVFTDQIGSAISHAWRAALCPFQANDAVGCNIFGIWDVVPALERGVPVVMIRNAVLRDPLSLAGVIVRHGITRMMLTPTLLAACLASPTAVAALRRLRLLVLCGERAKPATLRRAERELADTRLLDLYSISECHDVAAGFVHEGRVHLNPAPYASIRLVEPRNRMRPVRPGAAGRVLVGGPGIALGYLDTDSDAFFEQDGTRWYDTGDLGKLQQTGELTVVGRIDAGLKIRGRWVDPAEIEAALAGHPDVVDVRVTAHDDRLLARVVGRGAGIAGRLKRFAAEVLPAHAVPDRIERVDRLDLTPSGKAGSRFSRPEGNLEIAVVAAFREVLQDPSVDLDDTFADLGGTSLDAVALCGRLEQITGRPIGVAQLLSDGRPRAIARLLARLTRGPAERWRLPDSVPAIRRDRTPGPMHRPLVTGASGFLGQAVSQALGDGVVELQRPAMDLDQPLLGLSRKAFEALALQIDGVVHVAARVDPFAAFATLYTTNVQGTLALIHLAGMNGLPFRHVSSSAVLPLGGDRIWTPDAVPSTELAGALRASGADAYSYTKLGAEIALKHAADHGLPVRIVRVPHVIGNPRGDRLVETLAALCAAGVYPEGDWQWQFVTRELVVDTLLAGPASSSAIIRHAALPPVALAALVKYLDLDLKPVPMAAIATALNQVDPRHPYAWAARVLRQLVSEHGPTTALSTKDAILSYSTGDPLPMFEQAFKHFVARVGQ